MKKDESSEALIALFDNYNKRLKDYQAGLEKDFPKTSDLFDYIRALEQYCVGKLETKNREETKAAVVYANKKRSGREPLSAEDMQKKIDEVAEIRRKNPKLNLEDACREAGTSGKTHRKYKTNLQKCAPKY